MDNASVENDCKACPEEDASSKTGLEMTQCAAGLSSSMKKRKRKKKKKKQKRRRNSLQRTDMDSNHLKGNSIGISSEELNCGLHHPVNTCLSTDLEMTQNNAKVTLSRNMGERKKKNTSFNVLTRSDSHLDFHEVYCQPSHCLTGSDIVERVDEHSVPEDGGDLTEFEKCLDASLSKKQDNNAQFNNNSFGQSTIVTYKRKKKRRKLSNSSFSCLGSKESVSLSGLVLLDPDSSVRDTSLSHNNEAAISSCPQKMVGEVMAGYGTSLLVAGDISPGKASKFCPYGASGEQEKKTKIENLEKLVDKQNAVKDAAAVDLSEKASESGNRDAKLDVNSAEDDFHKPTSFYEDEASDDASGSVKNQESDNLDMVSFPMYQERDNLDVAALAQLKKAIPSVSQLSVIPNDVNADVTRKKEAEGAHPGKLRKKLLVLDVNGLLADIVLDVAEGYKPDMVISRKAVFKRPFCNDFLQFCFETFNVGVWTSRTKKNVDSVLDFLMGKSKHNLLFCWDQSHCTETGYNTVEKRDKPMVLKELKKLWEKHEPDLPWERGEYNESNTLLLDDSPYKALRNPPYTAVFPHSYRYKDIHDNSLGPGGDLRVYLEGLAMADNVQKYVEGNPFGQRPITERNLSWTFYLKIMKSTSSPQEEDTNLSLTCQ
ncbi:Phosphoprotein phosphatase [Bertholletia excelsa]